MKRKFECKNCKAHFEADNAGIVNCPQCGSDNVDYAKFHLPWRRLIALLCIIVVVRFGVWLYQNNTQGGEDTRGAVMPDDSTAVDDEKVKNDSVFESEGGVNAPSLKVVDNEYDKSNDTYSFRVIVSYPPKQSWKVVVKTRGGELIAESETGGFEGVPFSADDGCYAFTLVEKSSGLLLTESLELFVFPKQVTLKPWSAEELERALAGDAKLVDTPYIAKSHKVIVVNKSAKDQSQTGSLRDVQLLGLKAKVEAVEYDKMNKINVAKIRIDYPEDWLQEED